MSAAGYGGIISLYQYIFSSPVVFTVKMVPQVWRIFTAFLITKPKFAILLDPYFLYQYGSSIERESSRFSQPGDFFVYTIFVGSVIVVSSLCLSSRLGLVAPENIASTHVCELLNEGLMTTSDYLPAQPTISS